MARMSEETARLSIQCEERRLLWLGKPNAATYAPYEAARMAAVLSYRRDCANAAGEG